MNHIAEEIEEHESINEDFHLIGLRPYACPECPEEFAAPELLAPHLERHNIVKPPAFSKRGQLRSKGCLRGCGRYFRVVGRSLEQAEMNAHMTVCDGADPLPFQPLYVRAGNAGPL